jgi:O-methyltransferase
MRSLRKMLHGVAETLPDWARTQFWVRPPFRANYNADGFATLHAADFLNDPAFMEAYRAGASTPHRISRQLHVEWRTYVCCWAASQALFAGGALVECGVNTGIIPLAVATYIGLDARISRPYYLLDTYRGIPEAQLSEEEREHGTFLNELYYDCYDSVVDSFRPFPSVKIVRGEIPGTLSQIETPKISYLMVDLNVAYAEQCVLEQLWDRLTEGALIVLDDYGWEAHKVQRKVHDDFAKSKGLFVLPLPTGQGIIMKPASAA